MALHNVHDANDDCGLPRPRQSSNALERFAPPFSENPQDPTSAYLLARWCWSRSDQSAHSTETSRKLCRKKCATRSADYLCTWMKTLKPMQDNSESCPRYRAYPPRNGGFPTIASNPPFSRANTSGNSISQWNGVSGCSPLLQGRGNGGELVPCRRRCRCSQLSTSARFFSRAFGLSAAKNAAITASPIRRDVLQPRLQ